MNFYEQRNNFIFVTLNGNRVKLYNNNKLTIVDAAIQVGLANEVLFPRRGKALNFTVNGEKRMVRGELGEAAVVKLNGKLTGINTPIEGNDQIEIIESTIGADAEFEVRKLPEYNSTITFMFNNKKIICPKFVMVGDELVSEYYNINDQDNITILDYYTLEQVLEFMDIPYSDYIYVNNKRADLDEKIYANFSITFDNQQEEHMQKDLYVPIEASTNDVPQTIDVIVNGEKIILTGKKSYILVDVLDFYYFDMTVIKGSGLNLLINGNSSEFTDRIEPNDEIEISWRD